MDGRTVHARGWLLALGLLLAGGIAVLGLRLALAGMSHEPAPTAAGPTSTP